MDILRDPVWQFVGVVLAAIPLVAWLVVRMRSRQPRRAAYDVYLSYPGDDRPAAVQLMEVLEAQGLKVFMDLKLSSGEDWQTGLDQALRASKGLGFCITPNSLRSTGQQQEIGKALSLDLDRVRIMPLLLPGVTLANVPTALQRFMAVDLRAGINEETVAPIVHAVRT